MKLALWNNLPSGGGKRALRAMAEGLIARGHQLESWCPPTACLDFEPMAELMSEHVVDYRRLRRRPLNRFLPGRRGFGRQYREMERHAQECARQIDAGGFDACLIGNCQEFAVPPIGRYLKTPTVHYCQELWRGLHEALFQEGGTQGSGLQAKVVDLVLSYWQNWQRHCEREDLASFDLVLVNSCFSRESLLRAHGRESKVCYLGIDSTRFNVSDSIRSKTVIGLGALQRHKDIRTAILALATIPEPDRPNLIWVGNDAEENYVAEVVELARSEGVDLMLRRRITDEELVSELNRAALMIYTSHLEPFGFAPLEANACGLPVVAIGEGGVRETVRDGFNGVLLTDRDPFQLGAAVNDLLHDPQRARRLGENGRDRVAQFWTWERCAERLEQLLRGVGRR